jgi:hypothetical protein
MPSSKYKINERIVLTFQGLHGSEDMLITPMENCYVVIRGNTVYYEAYGEFIETIMTVGWINQVYIANGILTLVEK